MMISFSFYSFTGDLSEYNKGFVNWHKQPTIEISRDREGAVNVYVLEHEQTVAAGDGFFISGISALHPSGAGI